MGNIITYLKWRGDLDFRERPFCEADNLVLSALVYLDFTGIVPETAEEGAVTVKEAAGKYVRRQQEEGQSPTSFDPVLAQMAAGRRYRDAQLSCYRQKTEETIQTQFAALQIGLGDGTFYLAFRGTDDSIVGWREDFSISYRTVPAQQAAVEYLRQTMTREGRVYRLGGHSKGGNLAMYAAAMCGAELADRLIAVYNNDGPGICPDMLDAQGYDRIRDRLVRIVPQFSVIGMLFEPDVPPLIVASSARGLMQHRILTWEIDGDGLVRVGELAEESRFYNRIFDTWIESADMEQREVFTRDFFDALEAGGASTIPQVAGGGLDGFGTILLSIVESESRTKIVIGKFVRSFAKQLRRISLRDFFRSREWLRGGLTILAGLVFFLAPEFAVQSIGTAVAVVLFGWGVKKLLDCAMEDNDRPRQKKRRLIVYIVFLSLMVFLSTHGGILLVSGSMLLGVLFLAASLQTFRRIFQEGGGKIKKLGMTLASILLSFKGIVTLVTP